jgi:hypothetical protein
MAGLPKYFLDTPYKQIDGNIVYAAHLNNPLAAIAAGLATMSTDIQTGSSKFATDTGDVNAFAVSISPAPDEYAEGLEIWLKAASTCTGPSTINVNSLGPVEIRRHGLEELSAGDISANYFTHLKYSNGYFQIVSASGRGEVAADEAEASAAIATANAAATSVDVGLTNQARIDCNDILTNCSGYSSSASNYADTAEGFAVIANSRATTATEQATIATDAASSLTGAIADISDLEGRADDLETLVGGGVLGVGQTWQDVTSSRVKNVTYTNTTDRPIMVSVSFIGVPRFDAMVYVDELIVGRTLASAYIGNSNTRVTAIVPVGSTYRAVEGLDNRDLFSWYELR